jgi:ethanolaminephosphotransferase
MVSGAIGGFLDVALNFNTQAFLDDNLLGQNLLLHPYSSILLFPTLYAKLATQNSL